MCHTINQPLKSTFVKNDNLWREFTSEYNQLWYTAILIVDNSGRS